MCVYMCGQSERNNEQIKGSTRHKRTTTTTAKALNKSALSVSDCGSSSKPVAPLGQLAIIYKINNNNSNNCCKAISLECRRSNTYANCLGACRRWQSAA